MEAPLASNRKVRLAYIEPGDVRWLSGYRHGTRTQVMLKTGQALHLEMPVDRVKAALAAESRDILRRGLARLQAKREEFEAAYPEWAAYFDLLRKVDADLATATDALITEGHGPAVVTAVAEALGDLDE